MKKQDIFLIVDSIKYDQPFLLKIIDRTIPKPVYYDSMGIAHCRTCNHRADFVVNGLQFQWKYCGNCGAALEWGDNRAY